MQMIELVQSLCSLMIGILSGYYYGLSLMKQGKALSAAFALPIIRITFITLFGLFLLQWGVIPFILFIVSLVVTMWIVIFTHSR